MTFRGWEAKNTRRKNRPPRSTSQKNSFCYISNGYQKERPWKRPESVKKGTCSLFGKAVWKWVGETFFATLFFSIPDRFLHSISRWKRRDSLVKRGLLRIEKFPPPHACEKPPLTKQQQKLEALTSKLENDEEAWWGENLKAKSAKFSKDLAVLFQERWRRPALNRAQDSKM